MDRGPIQRPSQRDYIWKLKRRILKILILPNHYITKAEEDLYYGLLHWILENTNKRRAWTLKIAEDLKTLKNQKILVNIDGREWTYENGIIKDQKIRNQSNKIIDKLDIIKKGMEGGDQERPLIINSEKDTKQNSNILIKREIEKTAEETGTNQKTEEILIKKKDNIKNLISKIRKPAEAKTS